jgi:hypothetical protein
MWRILGPIGVAAVLGVLWVAQCSGPQAEVVSVELVEPARKGAPYQVHAMLRNEGPGHGEVNVTARLRERASGRTVQQERKAHLREKETTLVVVEVPAPRGSYTPEVEVDYPPQ